MQESRQRFPRDSGKGELFVWDREFMAERVSLNHMADGPKVNMTEKWFRDLRNF